MQLFIRLALGLTAASALAGLASGQTCVFSITPSSQSFTASGGIGTINIRKESGPANCERTARSNVNWATISFGQDGTDNGSAGYTVQQNNTPNQRTGTLTVAGQTFTVFQDKGACQFQFSPSNGTVAAAGGAGTFSVSSACGWTASSSAAWLSATGSSTTGTGTVSWAAAANPTASQRTGSITVGTATFAVTQAAACAITLSPSSVSGVPAAGGTGSFNVSTSSSCAWTARSNSTWITVTAGGSDTGNGTVNYSIAANSSQVQRFGQILVNDMPFNVTQAGSNCTTVLNPSRAAVPVAGGVGTFAVTSTCAWTAVSASDWVTITSGGSGTTSGTVAYAAAGNSSVLPRGGFIQVGSVTFVLDQPGAGCEVYLDENSASFGAEGGNGSFRFTTLRDCTWTANSSSDWIKITGPTSGSGPEALLAYSVQPNGTVSRREGTITVGDKFFRVVQGAAACSVSLGIRTVDAPASGTAGSIPISANCPWRASPSDGWIQITSADSGSADAALEYRVQANSAADGRSGRITVNNQAVEFRQAGKQCALSVSERTVALPARGGTGSLTVSGEAACNWSATSDQTWLTVEWASVSGTGTVRFSAPPNASGAERAATLAIGGQTVAVRQPAIALRISAAGIVNAASFRGGPVAPGEIVTVYGDGFGPEAIATARLSPDGKSVVTALADTRVLFDGTAAPMVFSANGQSSATVPYRTAGRQTVTVEVEYLGVRSNAVVVPVAEASPAIFTATASGRGQAAIVNEDNSFNGVDRPAARGSVVQIYATGEGETTPAGVDGRLAEAPLPEPVLPVRVRIGGVEAQVLYAGAAPGQIAGLMQINARVPDEVVPGTDVPVTIRIGDFESPDRVTMAVK